MGTVPETGAGCLLRRLLLFVFFVILFGAYSNTFTSPPLLDDYHSFIFEKSLYLDQLSLSSILHLTQSKFGYSRYIPVITLALNHKLGHSNLVYFHLVNIFIHFLSFLAVYFLAKQILSLARKNNSIGISDTMEGWLPLLIAALWALNPVQTNAVTYLVQRMASLVGLFYFLAVGCYIKARLFQQEGKRSIAWWLGTLLSALSAFLSKENSVLLPFSLALVEIWFFDSALLQKAWRFLRKLTWKSWTVIVITGAVCFSFGINVLIAKVITGYDTRHFTLSERLLTEGRIVIWYISLLFYPNPSRLSVEHYVDLSTSLISPPTTLISLLLIAALIGGSLYYRKRAPLITFGILWFFLNISLESTIIPLELVFEHRLYIPSFGIFLSMVCLLAILLRSCLRKMPELEFTKAFCSVAIVFICCSALLTFLRNEDWQTSLSIHEDIVTKAPELPRSNANYANALLGAGQYDEAIKYAEKAIALSRPGLESYAVAANAIVTAYLFTGRNEEAIEKGKELIAQFPKRFDADSYPLIRLNMAQAYMVMKDEKSAYEQILESFKLINQIDQQAIQKKDASYSILRQLLSESQKRGTDLNGDGLPDPGDVPVDFWIAMELQKIGENAYTRQLLEREYSRNPENALVSAEIQRIRKEEELTRAQKEKWNFDQKYVRHPFSKFNLCMAVAFLAEEKNLPRFFKSLGEKCLNIAMEINPNSADALLLKGWYLYSAENAQEAVAVARKALEYDPDNAKAWLGLGFFLIKAGSPQDALAAFDKVIEIYPTYSNRPMIEALSTQLRKGEPVETFSVKRGDSASTRVETRPAS